MEQSVLILIIMNKHNTFSYVEPLTSPRHAETLRDVLGFRVRVRSALFCRPTHVSEVRSTLTSLDKGPRIRVIPTHYAAVRPSVCLSEIASQLTQDQGIMCNQQLSKIATSSTLQLLFWTLTSTNPTAHENRRSFARLDNYLLCLNYLTMVLLRRTIVEFPV